jgi:hypothetical protein
MRYSRLLIRIRGHDTSVSVTPNVCGDEKDDEDEEREEQEEERAEERYSER